MNNHLATMIREMARRNGVTLTGAHLGILEFAHEYHAKHHVGPLFPNIARHTGATRGDIERLFPYGLRSVYIWVGIPVHSPHKFCKPMAQIEVEDRRDVYLDHNATTYLRDEVRALLLEQLGSVDAWGNPSSSTDLGEKAYRCVQVARRQIAACLGVTPPEIVFVGCGSEANNLAIKGIAFRHLKQPGHLITTTIEHASVLESMRFLEGLGFSVTYLPCEPDGRVTARAVREALRPNTLLVSVMGVQNEIGVINPIAEIGEVCREAHVPFMVDGVQSLGKIPLSPRAQGISLLSLSGHKIYAPKGVAALYVDRAIELVPLIHGGAQENSRRAGTESVASIAAFGRAAELAVRELEGEQERLRGLRDYFLARLAQAVPDAIVNGSLEHRVTGNLNIGFPGVDSGSLLLSLNQIGVYVSSGAACHAGAAEVSHVIRALGVDTDRYGSLRFSFGLRTTREDLDYLFKYLPEILSVLRRETEQARSRPDRDQGAVEAAGISASPAP